MIVDIFDNRRAKFNPGMVVANYMWVMKLSESLHFLQYTLQRASFVEKFGKVLCFDDNLLDCVFSAINLVKHSVNFSTAAATKYM
jgi:hypothetical protein